MYSQKIKIIIVIVCPPKVKKDYMTYISNAIKYIAELFNDVLSQNVNNLTFENIDFNQLYLNL